MKKYIIDYMRNGENRTAICLTESPFEAIENVFNELKATNILEVYVCISDKVAEIETLIKE